MMLHHGHDRVCLPNFALGNVTSVASTHHCSVTPLTLENAANQGSPAPAPRPTSPETAWLAIGQHPGAWEPVGLRKPERPGSQAGSSLPTSAAAGRLCLLWSSRLVHSEAVGRPGRRPGSSGSLSLKSTLVSYCSGSWVLDSCYLHNNHLAIKRKGVKEKLAKTPDLLPAAQWGQGLGKGTLDTCPVRSK